MKFFTLIRTTASFSPVHGRIALSNGKSTGECDVLSFPFDNRRDSVADGIISTMKTVSNVCPVTMKTTRAVILTRGTA